MQNQAEILDRHINMVSNLIGESNRFSTRQQNIFIALMQHYPEVLKAQALETESAGLAQERYAIYLNSTEAASNRLTTAWEKLITTTTNSDFIKGLLNIGTALIGIADGAGLLNIALTLVGTYLVANLVVSIPQVTTAIAAFCSDWYCYGNSICVICCPRRCGNWYCNFWINKII